MTLGKLAFPTPPACRGGKPPERISFHSSGVRRSHMTVYRLSRAATRDEQAAASIAHAPPVLRLAKDTALSLPRRNYTTRAGISS